MKHFILPFFVIFLCSCAPAGTENSYTQPFMTVIEENAQEITQTKEFGDCVTPTVNMCITQVANELARKENSVWLCDKLQNGEEIQSCKYGVIIAGLATNNDINQCDTLDAKYKMECQISSVSLLATAEGDSEICNQISDFWKDVQGNTLEKNRVDQCKFSIIMGKTDLKLWDCDGLLDKSQKETCISMVKNRKS
jgi:hypothetical protein